MNPNNLKGMTDEEKKTFLISFLFEDEKSLFTWSLYSLDDIRIIVKHILAERGLKK